MAIASGHRYNETLLTSAPTVDWLITGANKGSPNSRKLPPGASEKGAFNKGACPLCFHRELIRKQLENTNDEAVQPFPED
jgi:hypothetical protein